MDGPNFRLDDENSLPGGRAPMNLLLDSPKGPMTTRPMRVTSCSCTPPDADCDALRCWESMDLIQLVTWGWTL